MGRQISRQLISPDSFEGRGRGEPRNSRRPRTSAKKQWAERQSKVRERGGDWPEHVAKGMGGPVGYNIVLSCILGDRSRR